MVMQVNGSSSTAANQNPAIANWQQRQQDFKSLMSALQSGDLSAAQSAYLQLTGTANVTSSSGATSSTASSAINGNSPLAQIGQALQNGDLASAQKAAQALQSSRGAHHHHHHGGQKADASAVSALTSTPTTSSTDTGSILDMLA
jgi:soluble cytochrome b562